MEQNQICSICQQQPQELLILSCQHNLCVNCATEVFVINEKSNPLCCQICLTQTQLDQDTIGYLTQLTERKITKKPPKSKKLQKRIQNQPQIVEQFVQQCPTHKQKPIYFCFDCKTGNICSQCILTPKHSNHNVVTIKKATNIITKQLKDRIKQKKQLRDELITEKNKYISSCQQNEAEISQKKNQLKEIFDDVIGNISEYFAQLTSLLQNQAQKVEQMLRGSIKQIQQKIGMIQQGLNYDSQLVKKSQKREIINFYEKSNNQNFQMYYPRLPQEIPVLDLRIRNYQTVNQSISKVIHRIIIDTGVQKNMKNHQNSFECSIIQPELIDMAEQQQNLSALRQSRQQKVYLSNLYSQKKYQQDSSHVHQSRKLEMSRSIDNATNIINKLQKRSRLA